MLPRLPPLIALRAFHALGVTGSVRAAGDALGVSHTVISRHVHNLQEALGVTLVRPSGRGLALTPAGRKYFNAIAGPLTAIADAARQVTQTGPTLTLRCVPGFANIRLLPRLPELRQMFPGREVVLQVTLSRRLLVNPEVDVEVVYFETVQTSELLRAELLAQARVFPVMSPSLYAAQGGIRTVEQLAGLPMLHDDSFDLWRRWLRSVHSPVQAHGACLGTAQLAIDAALLDQGVAITNELLVEEHLREGRLIEPLPSDLRPKGYYFVAEAARWDEPEIATIRSWLHQMSRIGAKNTPITTN